MSKYDCSKTLDYFHEKKRMCDAQPHRQVQDYDTYEEYPNCANCPLKEWELSCDDECEPEMIEIVQKWSDENPTYYPRINTLTRIDKLEKLLKGTEFEGIIQFDSLKYLLSGGWSDKEDSDERDSEE